MTRYPRTQCLFCGVDTETWAQQRLTVFPSCSECRSIFASSPKLDMNDRVQFVKERLEVRYGPRSARWMWDSKAAAKRIGALEELEMEDFSKRHVGDEERKYIERRNKIHSRRKGK